MRFVNLVPCRRFGVFLLSGMGIELAVSLLLMGSSSIAEVVASESDIRQVESSANDSGRTLGFVVRDWLPAVYETRFIDECPAGLNIGNDELWWRKLSKQERSDLTQDGLVNTLDRFFLAINRGPNGENVCINPEVITDDPPLLTVEGPTSFGINLDGNVDGSATKKSCAHENFTHPDGTPGIDNQLYRLIGCIFGYREDGQIDNNANEQRRTSGLAMVLMEVTGVDDENNDDDVTITFYRSIDQYALDSQGRVLPYSSYRVDTTDGGPRYGDSVKGKIVDGVLKGGPGDVRLPYYGNYNYMHPVIRDMSFELDIASGSAREGGQLFGMMYGYYDLEMYLFLTGGLGPVIGNGVFSCPAFFEAARNLADGYPDPETGECTHLSSAFEMSAFPAFIIHPGSKKESETAGR